VSDAITGDEDFRGQLNVYTIFFCEQRHHLDSGTSSIPATLLGRSETLDARYGAGTGCSRFGENLIWKGSDRGICM